MKNNPLPYHGGPTINVIEEFVECGLVKEVAMITTLTAVIRENLTEAGLIKEVHDNCELCLSESDECKGLEKSLQWLMD